MLTTAALLASLFLAANPATKAPAAPFHVDVGHGVRVTVPALGPNTPADKQHPQQVFVFYVGLFGR